MPVNFTLHYDDLTNDVDDTYSSIGAVAGIGWIHFEPVFDTGARIPVPTYSPRPAGFSLRPFKGYLDTDGRLRPERGSSTAGIRLWANDPAFNLDRLQYRVTAPSLTDPLGRKLDFKPFYFDAPSTDVIRYLTSYMPTPGQNFGRGPGAWNLVGGTFNNNGDLILQNEDGSTLSPIPTSDVLIFIDNGDGTWSIG